MQSLPTTSMASPFLSSLPQSTSQALAWASTTPHLRYSSSNRSPWLYFSLLPPVLSRDQSDYFKIQVRSCHFFSQNPVGCNSERSTLRLTFMAPSDQNLLLVCPHLLPHSPGSFWLCWLLAIGPWLELGVLSPWLSIRFTLSPPLSLCSSYTLMRLLDSYSVVPQ